MSGTARIRVLVIDDSPHSRQTISALLQRSPLVEVIGHARDGEEALRMALELSPDLATLDLEMPRMDGFTLLRLLMSRCPLPVIVISGHAGDGDVFKALELGAVDFIAKPGTRAVAELASIEQELIRKVHGVRRLRIDRIAERLRARAPRSPLAAGGAAPRAVAIGASTGGPRALMELFSAWVDPVPSCFLVAQHMPEGFTRGFAERLDRLTCFRAGEAQGGEALVPGTIWVAPGGSHLALESRDGRIVTRVEAAAPGDRHVPSVDRLFESAAKQLGSSLLAVVLTGMGDDGSRGVQCVRAVGGAVIAEAEATAVIYGMPKQALATGCVDRQLPLHEIPAAICASREARR